MVGVIFRGMWDLLEFFGDRVIDGGVCRFRMSGW